MDRANDASVIYLPRVRKPRHSPCLGVSDNLGAVPIRGVPPSLALAQTLTKVFVVATGGHMDIKTKYGWQELYATALLETDWSKIEEKIQVAENGIRSRLHEFSMNHGGTPEENQAIEDALHGLDTLRKDVAAWRERAS